MKTDEREWLTDAMQGDDVAFSYLVEAFQVPVYNLCLRMLGDPAEAEDAAQETFLKAYRGLRRYDPARPFVNWLLSIASHHCIDRLRRKRLLSVSLEDLLPGQQVADQSPGPETSFLRRERGDKVQQMLKQLGGKDRAVVVMRYWYDFSYEEIAEALSTSVSAVKSRLHRARKDLARKWSADRAMAAQRQAG